MGSCSNSCVQLQKEDIEHLRCKLSRLKKARALDETGSDWIALGTMRQWVLVQTALFSSTRRTTLEMQTKQAERSRRTL